MSKTEAALPVMPSEHVENATQPSSRGAESAGRVFASWEVEVFFDGDCPLCAREISFLRKRDRRNALRFTDIAAIRFRPEEYGKSMEQLMGEMHVHMADGTWVVGVEAFRRMYAAIGFGPLVSLTRLPLVSHALEFGYRIFARNRLKLTGRCSLGQGCGCE